MDFAFEDDRPYSEEIEGLVREFGKLSHDWWPTHLDCVCRREFKLELSKATERQVRRWIDEHSECLKEQQQKLPVRRY